MTATRTPNKLVVRVLVVGVAVLLVLTGCTAAGPAPWPWRAVSLPADPSGRDRVRAVAACAGRWYVAGAILHPDGTTAPALWTSSDAVHFTRLPIRTVSFYGPTDTLSTVACRGSTVVAVGASSGGAHGNPRSSTWLSVAGGPLQEIKAGFEVYGGENQIGLGTVTAGAPGFLLVGARLDRSGGAGAAVWTSADGSAFTLHDADPALESDPRGTTEVTAAAPITSGYIAVGGITPAHSRLAARDPIAWTSTDGSRWQRVPFPATAADDPLLAVVRTGAGVLAIGTDGTRFVGWTADPTASRWQRAGSFGSVRATGSIAAVSSMVTAGSRAYAVVSTGAEYQLWRQAGTRWSPIRLPIVVLAAPVRSGPRVVAAASAGATLMIATDDGAAARISFAPAN